ncbi:hypothetical protein CR513_39820, partial [Mucuna pruriens]
MGKRSEINEDLLKLFRKVEINILLLNVIRQIPKYAKFLKELYVHKRKKMTGTVKTGGAISALVKHENAGAGIQRILPKKCQDQCILTVPCTIDDHTFTDAMLDLGVTINVMTGLVHKSLNLRDLELTGMEVQLANKRVVQPLSMFSMEFRDSYMKFNNFEALKHPYEDHSVFNIDAIDELIEEYF